MNGGRGGDNSEVLFEFIQVGNVMRVAAFHVATGTEVFVVAPLSASQQHMQMLALGKLRRRLSGDPSGDDTPPASPSGRTGRYA